jgi:hypothetical protein
LQAVTGDGTFDAPEIQAMTRLVEFLGDAVFSGGAAGLVVEENKMNANHAPHQTTACIGSSSTAHSAWLGSGRSSAAWRSIEG